MHLKPLYERILLKNKPIQEVTSAQGLKLTLDMSQQKNTTLEAEVIAVGEGRMLADGSIIPLKVNVGDIVIYSKMSGESYTDGQNSYTIISETAVLMKKEGEK